MDCSNPISSMELRAPHEYVSIARLMSLPFDKAYAVITKNVEDCLSHGGGKRTEQLRRREAAAELFGSLDLLREELFVTIILSFL